MKKAQSEVITTVLIILLVLAAVFIVYTAVMRMVTKGTGTAASKADCIGTVLTVVSANASNEKVTITREVGGVNGKIGNVKILIDGNTALYPMTTPEELKMDQLTTIVATITGGFDAGQKIKAAAVLADTTVCDAGSEFTATAA